MKINKTYILIIGLIGILSFFSACNSDSKIKVDKEIEDSLFEKYKEYSITSLEWELIDNFFVGEYRRSNKEEGSYRCRSWFDSNGNWLMTEVMELIYDKDIPAIIIENFEKISGNTKGAVVETYKIDFADVEPRYIIETKSNFWFFRSNGYLFKEENNWKNRPIVIGKEILDFINKNYESSTTIIDANMNVSPLQVEIHEERYKTICFDSPTQWLATFWKIPSSEKVPDIVRQALFEITQGQEPTERYQMEYYIPSFGSNTKNRKISANAENIKIVYVFRFEDQTESVYIDENGEEVKSSEIPL